MGVYERNGYWYVEFRVKGKRIKKSIGKKGVMTKTKGRLIEQELKKKAKLEQWDLIDTEIPTLNAFKSEYMVYVKDVKRKRSWKRDGELLGPLCKPLGNKKLSEISVKDLEDFKLIRLQEVSSATVNRSLSVLRHLFNVAKKRKKFFGENPVSITGMLEENNLISRILTQDEEQRLLNSAISYLKPILVTALNTGMRRGEILNLKWADVDLTNNLIIVVQTNSKSKKARRVYINSSLKKLLLELKLKSGGNEYVFLDNEGNHLREIKNGFDGACRRAGIHGLRFHDLRHTAATRMIESGASIVAVSRILGHSDIKTTMRYAHPEDSLKDALENLANFSQTTTKITTTQIDEKISQL